MKNLTARFAPSCSAEEHEDMATENAEKAREFVINEFTTPGKQVRRSPITLDPKTV